MPGGCGDRGLAGQCRASAFSIYLRVAGNGANVMNQKGCFDTSFLCGGFAEGELNNLKRCAGGRYEGSSCDRVE
jgi:hypothetical protein